MKTKLGTRGFTLVEMMVGIVLLGVILLAFAGMANVMQRSSGQTMQYGDAQQNARVALDYITENLRAAGSDIAAFEGQTALVHAGPYQVGFNANLDHGAVLDGDQPMTAIDAAQSPNTVPASGTTIYAPGQTFNSEAETVVLTLDSDADGLVNTADRGDDAEEGGRNTHLFLLKRYLYGKVTGSTNTVRDAGVALVRGPVAYPDGSNPPALFEYWFNHDNDLTTADQLWGDGDADGALSSSEVGNLAAMPDTMLFRVRMIKVNVVAEGTSHDEREADNEGFLDVVMSSQVWIRNVDNRESARVFGTVYYDANGDGKRDPGEPGIPKAVVTLKGANRKTTTDAFGNYNLPANGGAYTVTETDPVGYTSTTPNSVNLTLVPGEKRRVDFGDDNTSNFGWIVGTVWDDKDQNTLFDTGEEGIPGVTIQLSNDMSVRTGPTGYYRFTVPVGSYSVTESDLVGYTSTTSNVVSATVVSGDSATVNFGDMQGASYGTLLGYVYIDDDEDGMRDFGEAGLSSVSITLSNGANTLTDGQGYYEFQLDPGKYDIYELDPTGYTSTTPNLIEDQWVLADSTVHIDFGDILIKDLEFVEILVGDTDRPLSIGVADMKEDVRADTDIVLGTPTSGGPGNIFFYINQWKDAATPLTDLFDPTPTDVRNGTTDVNAIVATDVTGDKFVDVITGQESYVGDNLLLWYNATGGTVGNNPDGTMTSGLSSAVTDLRMSEVTSDAERDLLVGLRSSLTLFTGGFEVLAASGGGSYYSQALVTTYGNGTTLGAVVDIEAADLDGDFDRDIVVASNQGDYWGHFDIYKNDGSGNFTWFSRYLAKAGVNDVAVVETFNDGSGRPDILVGVSEAQNAGGVQIWYNQIAGFGKPDSTTFVYEPDTQPKIPNSYFNADGEALAISAARLDADIFPEIVIGTRASLFYTGDLLVVRTLDGASENIKNSIAGEVVTIDFGDFDKDAETDIVVTTRVSQTSGKLAIYFLDSISVVP
jgi:prepilin-type N-terminal cleavage/methylation domain-containing protein